MKEIEGDTKKWKSRSRSWVGRTNIVKMSTLPQEITHLMQSLTSILHRTISNIPKICIEAQKL